MNIDISIDYLDRASIVLNEAKQSSARFDWPHCIWRSAECVEFSLKAILQLISIDYKKDHDVSGYLKGAYGKFPAWFNDKIPRFASISHVLTSLCLQAKYGDELLQVSSKRIFSSPEAQAYLQIANEIYLDCNRLFWEIKKP